MSNKILFFDFERCSGCRLCELVCSSMHTKTSSPTKSRIRIIKHGEVPITAVRCLQCEEAFCINACPTKARKRNSKTGAIIVDDDRCVGCRYCMEVCPFGGTSFDFRERKIIVCDLCEGDPTCVKVCTTRALEFLKPDDVILRKGRKYTEIYKMLAMLPR